MPGLSLVSDYLRRISVVLSAEPDEIDPNYLFEQIQPYLNKFQLASLANPSKTALVPGKSNKNGDNLFHVQLRRTTEITPDKIDRIRRNMKNFSHLKWSDDGILIFVWSKYIPQANEKKE